MQTQQQPEKKVFKDVKVERERGGTRIILPEGMSIDDGLGWLAKKKMEEESTVAVREVVDTYPLDGAYALMQALAMKYGWTNLVSIDMGFFGKKPPAMVAVEVDVDKSVQVVWGRMEIPGIDGFLQTHFEVKNDRFLFMIIGEVKRKHEAEVHAIADLVREFVKKESIYRGKAIRVRFAENVEEMEFNPFECPKFIDTRSVNENDLIFSEDIQRLVTTSLFTPITHTAACRLHKIPLKRGILLEGPYGCGKTLTAYVAAQKCVQNGWTFIYLDQIKALSKTITFARQYMPAVIFAEDIDSILSGDERDEQMDKVLNTIDGIEVKHSEVLVVLTTNHVEKIHKAMLRPGRLDAVISIQPPDQEAAIRLIKLYGRNLLREREDLSQVGKKLAGQIPAVIREVVERSKLAAIGRTTNGEALELTAIDLDTATNGMLNHLALLKEVAGTKESVLRLIGKVAGEEIGKSITRGVERTVSALGKVNGFHGEAEPIEVSP